MDVFSILIRACGIAILASVCLMIVGKLSGAYSSVLRIGASLLIFGIFVSVFETVVAMLKGAVSFSSDNSFASKAFELMLKGLGIALIGRFCSDVCRDCGEQTLANGVESVGRIAIFGLSVPMLVEILSSACELL